MVLCSMLLESRFEAPELAPRPQFGILSAPFLVVFTSLRQMCETRSRCSESAVFEGSEDPKTVSLAALREGLFNASVEVLNCFIFDPFWGAFVLNLGSF